MNTKLKVALAIVPTGLVILAGWYVVDRVFIQKAPLYPFSLAKAKEKKANDALTIAKKKLNSLMEENKINGFGIVADADTKKNYIEVATERITADLKKSLPEKVQGVEVRLVERPTAKAL